MKTIKRTGLNNRHKIVRLIHKGQNVQALEYCLQKGHLINKEIIQKNDFYTTFFKDKTIDVLHLDFYINGYYVYFEIRLNTQNGLDPKSALYWNNELLLNAIRHYHYSSYISINKNFN